MKEQKIQSNASMMMMGIILPKNSTHVYPEEGWSRERTKRINTGAFYEMREKRIIKRKYAYSGMS